jgi:hypothetical protein
MEHFRVFRALVLAFKAWFTSFVPIMVVAAIVYAPIIVWLAVLPGAADFATGNPAELRDDYMTFFTIGSYLLLALGTLLPPLITYRVIQYMNGRTVSMLTSVRFGLRGILPAVVIAVVTFVVGFIPMGFVIQFVLTCYWFVAAPTAVAEKVGVGDALSRSAYLTAGRRGGIFGLVLLTGVSMVVALYVIFVPAAEALEREGVATIDSFKLTLYAVFAAFALFQLLRGIVQAVSYSLLRTDKDGVSTEELAAVFE